MIHIHRLKVKQKENKQLKKELKTQKMLKTRAQNEVSQLKPEIAKHQKALDGVQSDKKTIEFYKSEITRIANLQRDRDQLRQKNEKLGVETTQLSKQLEHTKQRRDLFRQRCVSTFPR